MIRFQLYRLYHRTTRCAGVSGGGVLLVAGAAAGVGAGAGVATGAGAEATFLGAGAPLPIVVTVFVVTLVPGGTFAVVRGPIVWVVTLADLAFGVTFAVAWLTLTVAAGF